MFAEERHKEIQRIVREARRLNFTELQKRIKVSPATLRRDLTELEQAGEIIRVHGGVLDPGYVRSEISFDERLLRNTSEKRAIASKAAAMIPPGASVFIDAGSTCLEAGRALLGRKDVRIVTHSVALIAAAMQGAAQLLCIGGELRHVSGALVGGDALGALANIRTDFAFLGASGVDPEGAFTTELLEAEMKRGILQRATRKILLCDASKWRRPSTVRFGGWSDFNVWIAGKGFPPADAKIVRSLGVDISTA